MKKRLLVLGMIIMLLQFTYALPATWSEEAVFRLKLQGVLTGQLATLQDMQKPITREEFAEMAIRLYLYQTGSVLENLAQTHSFTDTTNPYVGAAYRLGIVNGVSATRFDPKANVTREQIATMLHRELIGMGVTKNYQTPASFADQTSISTWAKEGVAYARYHSLVQGVGNNRFAPKNPATREQVFVILDNILKSYGWGATAPPKGTSTLNGYTIPSQGMSQLIFSEKQSAGIALRIQSGIVNAENQVLNMQNQWLQLFQTLRQKWSYQATEAIVLTSQSQWDATAQNYGFNQTFYVNASGKILSQQPAIKPYVQIRTHGFLIVDIYE